ncbi:MAG: regulatory protein RecX [Bdellovibrionota bacterium]
MAYNAIIRYVSRRDHSEKEIRTKLGRWYTPEAVQAAVDKAYEYKWIKDASELTEIFSRSLHRQGKGLRAVNLKLKTKGLPEVKKDSELEIEKAQAALARKYKTQDPAIKLDRPQKQKAYRFLANRGFDHDTIMIVLKI